MTLTEWNEIVVEVTSLWGNSPKWTNADKVYKYAKQVPAGAARSAVESLFQEGKQNAPSPSEIIAVARKLTVHTATTDEVGRHCHSNGHLWGIVEDHATTRTVVCARCGVEQTMLSGLVLTDAERETGDDTERIAP